MQELLLYIETLKALIDTYYEKETVFYDEGKWYSREHCRNITPEELTDWVKDILFPLIIKEEQNYYEEKENLCPICNNKLDWTYSINNNAKAGENPRIYGVICTNCCYEKYGNEI